MDIEATGNYIAGIIGGENGGGVYNSQNYGNIIGINTVGGINSRYGKATNCQNYGKISGTSSIGGINGEYATIEGCKNYGEIEGENNVGGIEGVTSPDLLINKSINFGKIEANSYVGGIVGGSLAAGYIVDCLNIGDIIAKENSAGGIMGYICNFKAITNCCNIGKIIGNNTVGGIIGNSYYIQNQYNYTGRIVNCYNIGDLVAEKYVGEIVGAKTNYGTNYIENCYWREETGIDCISTNISASAEVIISNSEHYTEEYMKTEDFLNKLNSYVETYNQGEKSDSKGQEITMWKFDEETGFPTLSF